MARQMKAKHLRRVSRYIREENVDKLKRYLSHRKLNLTQVLLDDNQSALHLACKYNRKKKVVSYLIKIGLNPFAKDINGNVSLMTAVNENGCSKVVLYLIKKFPELLKIANNQGICAQDVLDIQLNNSSSSNSNSEYIAGNLNADNEKPASSSDIGWDEKLRMESENDYFQDWGQYEEDYFRDGYVTESYDNWADRIRREYNEKKYANYNNFCPPKKRRVEKPEKPNHFFLKQQDEESKKRINELRAMKRKIQYEQICVWFFGENQSEKINLDHIPKPDDELISVIVDCAKLSADQKNFLRKQQIQWHPDKFFQKCSHRFSTCDSTLIIDRVKQISQLINVASEENAQWVKLSRN